MMKTVVSVVLAMAFSAGAETVDPAAYGLSPDAEPGVNVAAMRQALAGGNRTVKIAKRGVYRVDDTIENGLVENIVDLEGGACNFVRVLTGAVPDWHEGIVVRRGEPVRVGRRIYFVEGPVSKAEYVSKTMPRHTHGSWKSPEGVSFLYLQDDGCRTMDIRNVVFRNLTMKAKRGFLCYMDDNEWARSLHPEVPAADLPHAEFTVESARIEADCAFIRGCGNLDVTLKDVSRARVVPLVSMYSFNGRPVVQRVRASGLTYPEKGDDFVFQGEGIDAEVVVDPVVTARKPVLKFGNGAKAVLRPAS